MKRLIAVLLSVFMCFTFFACSDEIAEKETADSNESFVPILGVEIRNDEEASFYALTKSGTYAWNENGESRIYDGIFCLEDESLCTFTNEQTDGSINLKFTGSVEGYKIYSAEKAELDGKEKSEIINEKYFVSENQSKITFPESGEYYYVVDVKYVQGEVSYGFLLAE